MFDRAFILTSKKNARRLHYTLNHLERVGLAPEAFTGMDGIESGLRTVWTYEVDYPGMFHRIDGKYVCIQLAHLTVWNIFLYSEGDVFLIVEDDVRFSKDWREQVESAMAHLPPDWHMLYLGSCCVERYTSTHVYRRLYKVIRCLCTHAYVVHRRALKTLIEKCEKVYTKIDIAITLDAMPFLNCFAILPRVASQYKTELPT